MPVVSAAARHSLGVTHGRVQMIVHPHRHRDENDRIVDEVQLDPRNPDLTDARRDRAAKEVMVRVRLIEQQRVLEMMPELDPEGDHPPAPGPSDESLSEHPKADEHDQGKDVVQSLGAHQPWVVHAEDAHRHWSRPTQVEHLVSLDDVLGPVEEHDAHERVQSRLVPAGIETFINSQPARTRGTRMHTDGHKNLREEMRPLCVEGTARCQYDAPAAVIRSAAPTAEKGHRPSKIWASSWGDRKSTRLNS